MADPKGKGKKEDLIPTKPLRPLHNDPDFHAFRLEYKVDLKTGIIYVTYVCSDCALRHVEVHAPVKNFHAPLKKD
jgi:hypothetical protein